MRNTKDVIIKRYSNRKLYFQQEKRFINFTEVSQLLLSSDTNIKIIEYSTGNDITLAVMAKVFANFKYDKDSNALKYRLYDYFLKFFGKGNEIIKKRKVRFKFLSLGEKKGGRDGHIQEV